MAEQWADTLRQNLARVRTDIEPTSRNHDGFRHSRTRSNARRSSLLELGFRSFATLSPLPHRANQAAP